MRCDSSMPMPAIGSSSSSSRGSRGERHRDLELALLAVGQVRRQDIVLSCKADLLEHALRRLDQGRIAARGAPEPEAVAGVRLHRERDVVAAR